MENNTKTIETTQTDSIHSSIISQLGQDFMSHKFLINNSPGSSSSNDNNEYQSLLSVKSLINIPGIFCTGIVVLSSSSS